VGEGVKALAAVPAYTLKQAVQVRDLTTVRHVVPGHLPQGGSHSARLGHRGDDAPYFQVRIAQGSQVGAGSLFDGLVIAYLDIFRGGNLLRHLGCGPPYASVVRIRLHAEPGVPAVPDPHLRLRLQSRMDERVYHPGHMPQEPGDGITLVGRTSSQGRVVQTGQGAINHLPVPLKSLNTPSTSAM